MPKKATKATRKTVSKKERTKKWGWGGWRPGAGRPKSPDSGVMHVPRPKVTSKVPVMLTFTARDGFDVFREAWARPIVVDSVVKSSGRHGCAFKAYAIHDDKIVLLARAEDTGSLSRGAQGFSVRIARRLNAAYGTKGGVFGDRYAVLVLDNAEARAQEKILMKVSKRFQGKL